MACSPPFPTPGSATSHNSRLSTNIATRTATTCFIASRRRDTGWRTPLMRKRYPFDYAVVRVVPRVDRGEFLNAGVILFSSTGGFLDARVQCDRRRLKALARAIDVALVESYLEAIPTICAGGGEAGSIGSLSQRERF